MYPPHWPYVLNSSAAMLTSCRGFWVSTEAGMLDLTTGLGVTLVGNATYGVSPDGFGTIEYESDGSGDIGRTLGSGERRIDYTQPYTIAWVSRSNGFGTNAFQNVVSMYGDTTLAEPIAVGISNNGSYDDYYFGIDGGGEFHATVPSGVSMTERHWGATVFRGGNHLTASNHSLYVNGLEGGSPAVTSLGGRDPNTVIGGGDPSAQNSFDGNIFIVACFQRSWGQADAIAWWDPATRDAWRARPMGGIFIPAAAAGANPKGPLGMPLYGPFVGPIGP